MADEPEIIILNLKIGTPTDFYEVSAQSFYGTTQGIPVETVLLRSFGHFKVFVAGRMLDEHFSEPIPALEYGLNIAYDEIINPAPSLVRVSSIPLTDYQTELDSIERHRSLPPEDEDIQKG